MNVYIDDKRVGFWQGPVNPENRTLAIAVKSSGMSEITFINIDISTFHTRVPRIEILRIARDGAVDNEMAVMRRLGINPKYTNIVKDLAQNCWIFRERVLKISNQLHEEIFDMREFEPI
ncbi:MAG: hypothetical protein ACEQSB_00210 [Undibacterium sp.]